MNTKKFLRQSFAQCANLLKDKKSMLSLQKKGVEQAKVSFAHLENCLLMLSNKMRPIISYLCHVKRNCVLNLQNSFCEVMNLQKYTQ